MSEIPFLSALRDAAGQPISLEEEVRIWLDDERPAPPGWVHLRTAREVCMLLLLGNVIQLSLDSDLGGDAEFGEGWQVVDWIWEQKTASENNIVPRDGIQIHSANPVALRRMSQTLRRLGLHETLDPKPRFSP